MTHHARCDRAACEFHQVRPTEQEAEGAARAHHQQSGHSVTLVDDDLVGFDRASTLVEDAPEQGGPA